LIVCLLVGVWVGLFGFSEVLFWWGGVCFFGGFLVMVGLVFMFYVIYFFICFLFFFGVGRIGLRVRCLIWENFGYVYDVLGV